MKQTHLPLRRAFTLVEILVSTAILALLLVVLVTITNQTSRTWRYTTSRIEQFRDARTAFETMTRRLGQATLNTYWDYDSPTNPTTYMRQSDLRFVCGSMDAAGGGTALLAGVTFPRGGSGSSALPVHPTHGVFFQAPLGYVAPASANDPSYTALHGLDNLLNTWGYYVEVNDDQGAGNRPSIFATTSAPPLRFRSRLMELMQPSNDAVSPSIYNWTLPNLANGSTVPFTWFTDLMAAGPSAGYYHVLAENVVALVILPKLSKQDQTALTGAAANQDSALAPNYYYDSGTTGQVSNGAILNSKNQIPPVLQVTMVAIDEPSAVLAMPSAAQSAAFIENLDTTLPRPGLNLKNLFTDATKYASDLEYNPPAPATANPDSLENLLILNKVNYRIFTTNVSIRAAKWSQAQSK